MESLFISKDCKLKREDGTLVVENDDRKTRIPIHGLHQVVLTGEAGLTTSLVSLLASQGVQIVVLDWHGNVSGVFEPSNHPRSGRVRMSQAAIAACPTRRLDMARRIVTGASQNILANLRYRAYRGARLLEPIIMKIRDIQAQIASAADVESLMGYEGMIRAWYYDAWPLIDPRLDFGKRVRRPPNNPVNCLISWFNGLAYAMCRNEIAKTHLDDCLSFLHSPLEARASLALDLSEIFKPAICDAIIFEIVLRNTDFETWFQTADDVCRLTPTGRKETLVLWASRLDEKAGGRPSFRDLVRQEALAIERHVLGIAEYSPWRRKV